MIARETLARAAAYREPPRAPAGSTPTATAERSPGGCAHLAPVPFFRLGEVDRCRETKRALCGAVEALEYFDSLPPEAARGLVRELLEYYGDGIGRWLADAADYLAALVETDRELQTLADAAFPNIAHRIRLAAALRELLRTL